MNSEDINIENLILSGALEVAAVDIESGEILYQFTDKLKEVMPELYREHLNFVNSEVMYFWERGFLEFDDLTSEEPKVKTTEKCFNQQAISELPQERQRALADIVRVLKVV